MKLLDLFEGGAEMHGVRYEIFRIPGLVITGKNGALIAYCEARTTRSDWAPMNIMMRRSADGGETWGEPVILAEGVPHGTAANNPLMIAERNSDAVHLMHCVNYGRVYHLKSEDAGLTWGAPTEITGAFSECEFAWRIIATGPGHGIQLKNGRLLAPVWIACGPDERSHSNSAVTTVYSDDGGKTWLMGELIYYNGKPWRDGILVNPNESAVAELSDGRVMMNTRGTTDNKAYANRRIVTISPDGAAGWADPRFEMAHVTPTCFSALASCRGTLIYAGPYSETARERMMLLASEDDGVTWPRAKLIDPEWAAYADVNADENGNIYLLYERQDYNLFSFAKFAPDGAL